MTTKLGMAKPAAISHAIEHARTVEHKHVPGRAYVHTDSTAKLMSMIGGGFFKEPRYYDSNRDVSAFYAELLTTGVIRSTITDKDGLTEQARDVVNAAHAVANGPDPEDLLVLAAWARDPEKGLKLRYTPQIMLCVAAANSATKPFVLPYARKIIRRADEVRHVFAAYRHVFGKKKDGRNVGGIPHCLRRALAIALAGFSEYSLLKYDGTDRPTFKDVVLMLRGKDTAKAVRRAYPDREAVNWPLSRAMFEYRVNGTYREDASDTLKARKAFFASKAIDAVTPEVLEAAALTWENVISHVGSSAKTWELVIPLMAEMALMRNLRNFEQAGISKESWALVHEKLGTVVDTKQLPFRFFTASQAVTEQQGKLAAEMMLDKACQNVAALPGMTVVLVDNSGSALGAPVSGNSNLRVSDAGNMLAAIAVKRNGALNTKVGAFGDLIKWVPCGNDSCMSIKSLIDKFGKTAGQGTETGLWLAIHELTKQKVSVDRFILISDFCCYTQGDVNCGQDMTKTLGTGGDKATIQSLLDKYRRTVNPACWVHAIDLQGYGEPQIRPGQEKAQLLSGWSEQVFSLMAAVEKGEANDNQPTAAAELPAMTYLRAAYRPQ